jgi:hypothetical protein
MSPAKPEHIPGPAPQPPSTLYLSRTTPTAATPAHGPSPRRTPPLPSWRNITPCIRRTACPRTAMPAAECPRRARPQAVRARLTPAALACHSVPLRPASLSAPTPLGHACAPCGYLDMYTCISVLLPALAAPSATRWGAGTRQNTHVARPRPCSARRAGGPPSCSTAPSHLFAECYFQISSLLFQLQISFLFWRQVGRISAEKWVGTYPFGPPLFLAQA